MRKLVAGRIVRLREERGWTQRELAKRAGVSQKTISNYENPGAATATDNLKLDQLHSVAKVLGIGVWELLKEDDALTESGSKGETLASAGNNAEVIDIAKLKQELERHKLPMDAEITLRVAKSLSIHPASIMPEINEILPTVRSEGERHERINDNAREYRNAAQAGGTGGLTQEAVEFAAAWQSLPSDQRAALKRTTQALVDKGKEQVRVSKL